MIAYADQSDMDLAPEWLLILGLAFLAFILIAYALRGPENAAPAQESLATAPVPATKPDCSRRGHCVAKVADSPLWICWRDGCGETWLVLPDRAPFDQAKAEVIAEAEQLLRAGGAA